MLSYKTYTKYIIGSVVFLGSVLSLLKVYAADIQPFLYIPFSYKNYNTFKITEGRWYSGSTGYLNLIGTGEYFIHGLKLHNAVDYSLPYGTVVLAPMDGYLIASYHNAYLKEKGNFKLYQGKRINYGLGWYVQIWNPINNIFVILGHLSSIDTLLPVSPPYPTRGKNLVSRWDPTGVTYNTGALQKMINDSLTYPGVVHVKRGQRIGTIGVSGLEWGSDMKSEMITPRKPEYPQAVSRDEPHLHMEVFTVSGSQKQLIDPYNVYRDYRGYPDSNTLRTGLKNTLFMMSDKKRIRFADEK